MSDASTAMLAFPGGAPVIPTVFAHFGDESDPAAVPDLQWGKKLGGWLTLEDSVKKSSYHEKLQFATTQLVTSGQIYQVTR